MPSTGEDCVDLHSAIITVAHDGVESEAGGFRIAQAKVPAYAEAGIFDGLTGSSTPIVVIISITNDVAVDLR
jgi:hypothetical protein